MFESKYCNNNYHEDFVNSSGTSTDYYPLRNSKPPCYVSIKRINKVLWKNLITPFQNFYIQPDFKLASLRTKKSGDLFSKMGCLIFL